MQPARHLALWLAAAILMVAASLMPSAARAHAGPHAGHAHHAAAPAASVSGSTADHRVSIGAGRVSGVVKAGLGCTGACCQQGGHSCPCCATGLAPAADAALPVPPTGGPARPSERPSRFGIVPEAHAEPPRPFA